MPSENEVRKLIESAGGKVNEMGKAPDGSGWATASFPLSKTHWIYEPNGEPPMPFKIGTDNADARKRWVKMLTDAGKYAIRGATMSGKDMDFDPDALIQNLIVGLLGYWTPDGTSQTSDLKP